MPTYEYRCKDCGADLEVQQSFHDEALTECPTCGGALKKRFGNVGISFKGSGFYKNDSRSSSGTSSSGTSSTSGSSSGSSEGSSTSDGASSSTTSSSSTDTGGSSSGSSTASTSAAAD